MCLIGAWCVLIVKLYWDHRRKEKLPQGSKPLPGPKGESAPCARPIVIVLYVRR